MRLAIFGGTFDPIHLGHVRIARHVTRMFKLDQTLFVTAARPPHKAGSVKLTPPCDRHAMVALALRNEKRFIPSNLELLSDHEKNYTVDTIARVGAGLNSSDELFFIMGADQFAELRTWRASDRLLDSVAFIVVSRPGLSFERILWKGGDKLKQALRPLSRIGRVARRGTDAISSRPPAVYLLPNLKINLSSTAIRARIAAGQSVQGWVDPAVADYIHKNRLYR